MTEEEQRYRIEFSEWRGGVSTTLNNIKDSLIDLRDNKCKMHEKDIAELKKFVNQSKGAGYILSLISGAVGAFIMFVIGKIFK